MSGTLAKSPARDVSHGFEGIPTNTRVIIVEDDQTTVDLVREQLASVGVVDFIVCLDGRKALGMIDMLCPDVVLLDIMMPHISGLEILQSVRGRKHLMHLPIIILTAMDDTTTKIRALEMGASDFLSKPIDFVELAPRIRNAVVSKFYRDALERQAWELQSRVDEQTERLRESYASLERANQVLRQSCEAAEDASRAKNDFLARMSHEMRTPLTAIIGFAEELLEQSKNPQSTAMVTTILRNGEHLLQLVKDLLDVAKIERGRLTIERVPCSPNLVLEEVSAILQRQAGEKGIEFTIAQAPAVPASVRTDPIRLQQILTNLVGNAIKFTDTGHVAVVVDLVDEDSQPKLLFEINDTGPGIPKDRLNDIFMPFFQVGEATTSRHGVGLGLTIAKYLVEELGGGISVTSQPGKGSTFRVTIATGPLEEGAVVAAPESEDARPAPSLAPYRILLAEDARDTQRLIERILNKFGAEVLIVDDGLAAWDAVAASINEQRPFDLILTDVQMPKLDGYELTRRLRSSGYTGKVVALTANAMAGERERCLSSGCDDYLTKPIARSLLMASIERCLEVEELPRNSAAHPDGGSGVH